MNMVAFMPVRPSLEVTEEESVPAHAIDLEGVFFLCSSCPRPDEESGFGRRVVSAAAIDAKCGVPAVSCYSSRKASLVNITQSLAVESAKDGLTVNCVCPGWVKKDGALNNTSWDWETGINKRPMGRMAEPEEVADLILHLALDSASATAGVPADEGCGERAGI